VSQVRRPSRIGCGMTTVIVAGALANKPYNGGGTWNAWLGHWTGATGLRCLFRRTNHSRMLC
jgi:hypothetical protein